MKQACRGGIAFRSKAYTCPLGHHLSGYLDDRPVIQVTAREGSFAFVVVLAFAFAFAFATPGFGAFATPGFGAFATFGATFGFRPTISNTSKQKKYES